MARISHWVAALALSLYAAPALTQDELNADLRKIAEPLVDEIIALVCDQSAKQSASIQIQAEEDADAFWSIQHSVSFENDWEATLQTLGDRPVPTIYRYKLEQVMDGQLAYVNVLDFTDGRESAKVKRRFTLNVQPENVSDWINGRRGSAQVPGVGEISFDDQLIEAPYAAAMVRRAGEWFLVVWRPEGQNSICRPDLGTETVSGASLLVDKFLVQWIFGKYRDALDTELTVPVRLTLADGDTFKLEFTLTQDQLAEFDAFSDFADNKPREHTFGIAILDLPLQTSFTLSETVSAKAALLTSKGPVEMWADVMIPMPSQKEGARSYRIFLQLPPTDRGPDAFDPNAIGVEGQQAVKTGPSETWPQTANTAPVTNTRPKIRPEKRRYETIKVGFDVYSFGAKDRIAENLILDRCDATLYYKGSKIGDLMLRAAAAENERSLALDPASIRGNLQQIGEARTENMTVALRHAAENTDNQPCPLDSQTFDLRLEDTADTKDTPFVFYRARLPHPDASVVLAMSFPAQGSVGEKLSTLQIKNYGYLLRQITLGLEAAYRPAKHRQYLTGLFGAYTLGNGTQFIRLDPPSGKAFSMITADNWTSARQDFARNGFTLERPTRAAFMIEAHANFLNPEDVTIARPQEVIFINYRNTIDAGTGQNPCLSNPVLETAGVALTQIIVMFDMPAFLPDFDIKGVSQDNSGVYYCDDPAREDLILIDAAAILQDDRHTKLPDAIRKLFKK